MKKELTIEHLAAYLPHRVTVKVIDFKSDYVGREYDIVVGLHQWSKCGKRWSIETEGGANPAPDKIKPLLRPLYQFTKDDLLNMGRTGYEDYIDQIKSGRIPYDEMQILLSQPWDVFSLIDSGLAEPIPSIQQQ